MFGKRLTLQPANDQILEKNPDGSVGGLYGELTDRMGEVIFYPDKKVYVNF